MENWKKKKILDQRFIFTSVVWWNLKEKKNSDNIQNFGNSWPKKLGRDLFPNSTEELLLFWLLEDENIFIFEGD